MENIFNASGEGVHKRRIHYSGKYPKKFSEKYKELQPEKYGEEILHVQAKGNTPAGMHIPIMVQEILACLKIQPGEQGLDCTLGYGGHSTAMLKCLQGRGHLFSTDIDPIELPKTEQRLRSAGFGEDLWSPRLLNFADADLLAGEVGGFDFVLADLGLSSMQIDNPDRGFTFKFDGSLDLRMDPTSGVPAWQRLLSYNAEGLEELFLANADEPFAKEIAAQIVASLHHGVSIITTKALYGEIKQALLKINMPREERKQALRKAAARVFQALRIEVNHELAVLFSFMEKLPGMLRPGGRVAVLTFHSGEDRIVKKAFKFYWQQGIYSDIAQEVTRPTVEECYANSRANSAKLRWAVKK